MLCKKMATANEPLRRNPFCDILGPSPTRQRKAHVPMPLAANALMTATTPPPSEPRSAAIEDLHSPRPVPLPHFQQSLANREKIQELLRRAIRQRRIASVKRIISQGADPSFPSTSLRWTPLMDAASMAAGDMIALFAPSNNIETVDADGRCALHHFISVLSKSRYSKPPEDWLLSLRRLLSPKTAKLSDATGMTALHLAASAWQCDEFIDFKEILSILGPLSDLSATASNGMTATAIALSGCPFRASSRASALFQADPLKDRCLALPDHRSGSLAHLAAANGCVDFLREISPLADLDAPDLLGRTPLMRAAMARPPACVDLLLDNGADPRRVDVDGCDALMLSIESLFSYSSGYSWRPLLRLASKSNLLARDSLGESAVDKAFDRRQPSLAKRLAGLAGPLDAQPAFPLTAPARKAKLQELLFEAIDDAGSLLLEKRLLQGADPREPFGALGRTPLMRACSSGIDNDILRLVPVSDLAAVDAQGATALLTYLDSRHIDSHDALFILTKLLSPESAAIADHQGRTPLFVARPSPAFQSAVIGLLGPMSDWKALDALGEPIVNLPRDEKAPGTALAMFGAHPDQPWLAATQNNAGQTIFHLAAKAGNLPFLSSLASHGHLAAIDALGRTALMRACLARLNRIPAIALLAPWSDCQVVDANGCDALMLLIEDSFLELDHIFSAVEILAPLSNLDARDFLGESAADKARNQELFRAEKIILAQMAIAQERRELIAASSDFGDKQRSAPSKIRI